MRYERVTAKAESDGCGVSGPRPFLRCCNGTRLMELQGTTINMSESSGRSQHQDEFRSAPRPIHVVFVSSPVQPPALHCNVQRTLAVLPPVKISTAAPRMRVRCVTAAPNRYVSVFWIGLCKITVFVFTFAATCMEVTVGGIRICRYQVAFV
jgi:hypothetical protein